MKILVVLLAGLSIGAIVAVAAVQLVRAVFVEVVDFFSEAWRSAEGSELG